jgi:UDP-N-acetyl-D-galactosamine dehydrogenase
MKLDGCTIAVIGLGYVGLPLAVEFGKKRTVIGFDIKTDRIAELQRGKDYTLEVSEDDLKEARHLTFSASAENLDEAKIFIVTVPTPIDKANRPDLTPLVNASQTVGRVLKPGDVVIYESTVFPGATEEICVPILEEESGLRYLVHDSTDPIAEGFYVGYSPERINPGDKTHRLPDIKKVTSGSTPQISEAIDALYREIIVAGTYSASSIKVAEAAKVIENSQRDLNIAFVNELSVIFNLMEIDTTEVLTAAATKWNFLPFRPGLVGGHCIGVDPYYLTHKAQEIGYQPQVLLAGRAINNEMGGHAARMLVRLMIKNGIDVANATVGVLGITFKENCPDVRNSRVVDVVDELQSWGLKVRVMDPWASPQVLENEYGIQLTEISSSAQVDSLLVAVAHNEFSNMSPVQLRAMCTRDLNPVIADLKAQYDRRALEAQGFTVFRL